MSFVAYALALVGATAAADVASEQLFAQLVIRQRTMVRIPAQSLVPLRPPPRPLRLTEKKGPKCIPMGALAGAQVVGNQAVDFIMRGGQRVRARLAHSCPALDFYSGFYIAPTDDGRVCADRDAVRSRAGGECEIDKFRLLVPAK